MPDPHTDRMISDRIVFKKVSGVEEGGGEPSSGSTPDKNSSDTCSAPEPSSAHLSSPDRHGQESVDAEYYPYSLNFQAAIHKFFCCGVAFCAGEPLFSTEFTQIVRPAAFKVY
jgi:hypothetical protein